MKHAGDYKNCNTLAVKAFYKTVDRAVTLKPNLKDKTKSRLDTVRVTPLFDTDLPFNDPFNDFVPDTARSTISNTVIL
jgi:hypothetical protein